MKPFRWPVHSESSRTSFERPTTGAADQPRALDIHVRTNGSFNYPGSCRSLNQAFTCFASLIGCLGLRRIRRTLHRRRYLVAHRACHRSRWRDRHRRGRGAGRPAIIRTLRVLQRLSDQGRYLSRHCSDTRIQTHAGAIDLSVAFHGSPLHKGVGDVDKELLAALLPIPSTRLPPAPLCSLRTSGCSTQTPSPTACLRKSTESWSGEAACVPLCRKTMRNCKRGCSVRPALRERRRGAQPWSVRFAPARSAS